MLEYSPVSRDGEPADAIVVHCLDPDFQPAYKEVIRQFNFHKYDPYVRPGGPKVIVDDPGAIEEIKLAHSLHKFPRAVLLPHINCKAYGIENESEEAAKHEEYLQLAIEGLRKAIPNLQVEARLIGWAGEMPTNLKP